MTCSATLAACRVSGRVNEISAAGLLSCGLSAGLVCSKLRTGGGSHPSQTPPPAPCLAEKGVERLRAELAALEGEAASQLKSAVHEHYADFVRATPGRRPGLGASCGAEEGVLRCGCTQLTCMEHTAGTGCWAPLPHLPTYRRPVPRLCHARRHPAAGGRGAAAAQPAAQHGGRGGRAEGGVGRGGTDAAPGGRRRSCRHPGAAGAAGAR